MKKIFLEKKIIGGIEILLNQKIKEIGRQASKSSKYRVYANPKIYKK